MKRRIGFLGLILTLPVLAFAGDTREAWDNLKQLTMGQQVRVVLNDLKTYSGTFQTVTEDGIVVRTDAGEQRFDRDNILRVSTKGESHRLRNALIGLGAGFGGGAAIAAGLCRNDSECAGVAVATSLPIGIAGGAGIGAAIPTGGWRDMYRAPKRETAAVR